MAKPKTKIKVLRGSRAAIAEGNIKLEHGELALDTTDGYLIAGADSNVANNSVNNSSLIVKAREVVGYANDSTTLAGTGYEDKKYSLAYYNGAVKLEGANISASIYATGNVSIDSGNSISLKSNYSSAGTGNHEVKLSKDGVFSVNGNVSISSDGKKLTVGSIAIDNASGNNSITVGNVSAATKISTQKVENGDNAVDIANISNVSKIAGNSNQTNINGNILASNEIDTTTVKVDSISNNSSNGAVTINGNTSISNNGNVASVGLVSINGTTSGQTSVTANTFNGNVSGTNASLSSNISTPNIKNTITIQGGDGVDGSTTINGVVVGNFSGTTNVSTDKLTVDSISVKTQSGTISVSGSVSINGNTNVSSDGKTLSVGDIIINNSSNTNSVTVGNVSATTKVSTPEIENVSIITGPSNQTTVNGNILSSNEIDTTTIKVDSISSNSSSSNLTISSGSNAVVINNNSTFNSSGSVLDVGGVKIDGTTAGSTSVSANTFNGNLSGNASCEKIFVQKDDVYLTNGSCVRFDKYIRLNTDNNTGDVVIGGGVDWLGNSTSVVIGGYSDGGGYNSVAIGNNASVGVPRSVYSNNSIAIGTDTQVGNLLFKSNNSVAIGYNASVFAEESIQLGNGSNTNSSTLQFINTKIADGSGNVYTGFSKGWSSVTPYNNGRQLIPDNSMVLFKINGVVSMCNIVKDSTNMFLGHFTQGPKIQIGSYQRESISDHDRLVYYETGGDSWVGIDVGNTAIEFKIMT